MPKSIIKSPAKELDISLHQSEAFSFSLTVKIANAVIQDFTNMSMLMHVRQNEADTGTPPIELSSSAGDIDLVAQSGSDDGYARVKISPTQSDIPPGKYKYDLLFIKEAGVEEYVLLKGKFEVEDPVTIKP